MIYDVLTALSIASHYGHDAVAGSLCDAGADKGQADLLNATSYCIPTDTMHLCDCSVRLDLTGSGRPVGPNCKCTFRFASSRLIPPLAISVQQRDQGSRRHNDRLQTRRAAGGRRDGDVRNYDIASLLAQAPTPPAPDGQLHRAARGREGSSRQSDATAAAHYRLEEVRKADLVHGHCLHAAPTDAPDTPALPLQLPWPD